MAGVGSTDNKAKPQITGGDTVSKANQHEKIMTVQPEAGAPVVVTADKKANWADGISDKLGAAAASGFDELNKSFVNSLQQDNAVFGLKQNVPAVGVATIAIGLSVNEQLLTPQNDSDPARKASGKAWSKVTVGASLGASTEQPVTHGVTGWGGASETLNAYAVVPMNQDAQGDGRLQKSNFNGLGATLADTGKKQVEGLAMTFDPSKLLSVRPPPGTEMGRTYTAALGGGVRAGSSVTTGVAHVDAGASVTTANSLKFSDVVEVMPPKADGHLRVFVARGRVADNSASASLGAGGHVETGINPSPLGKAVDRALNQQVGFSARVGGSVASQRPLYLEGEFDLDDPKQLAAYREFTGANPIELEFKQDDMFKKLQSAGVGTRYGSEARNAALSANLQFGQTNLLSVSSTRRSANGTIEKVETDANGAVVKKTSMSEGEYAKSVGGKIPAALLGRTGNVDVRGTEIVGADGKKSTGASLAMNVDVGEVDAHTMNRMRNLLPALGVAVSEKDAANAQAGGKGHLSIEFALTADSIDRLHAIAPQAEPQFIRDGFDAAYKVINGVDAPWLDTREITTGYPGHYKTTVKKELDSAMFRLASPMGDANERSEIIRAYKTSTNGRDLERDMASFKTREAVATTVSAANGAKPSEWGPALKAIGTANPFDFLTVGLAAHLALGAPLVALKAEGSGVSIEATPNLSARPATMADTTFRMTDRWNR